MKALYAFPKGITHMFLNESRRECQVVTRITLRGAKFCRKPTNVVLNRVPDPSFPVVMCLECARKLAIEILDSVPGGKLDVDLILAEDGGRR